MDTFCVVKLGSLCSYHDACTKHVPNAEDKSELVSKPILNKGAFLVKSRTVYNAKLDASILFN